MEYKYFKGTNKLQCPKVKKLISVEQKHNFFFFFCKSLKGGSQSRSDQMELISGMLHDLETSNELGLKKKKRR